MVTELFSLTPQIPTFLWIIFVIMTTMIIIATIHHTVTVCQAPSVNYLNYSYNLLSGGNITSILQRSKFGSSELKALDQGYWASHY